MRIEIIEPINPLKRCAWVWWVNCNAVRLEVFLDEYRDESRATTRHKFRAVPESTYHRLSGNRDWARMRGENVPPTPLDVLARLRDELNRRTEVKRP